LPEVSQLALNAHERSVSDKKTEGEKKKKEKKPKSCVCIKIIAKG